jgi:hypothetical protein
MVPPALLIRAFGHPGPSRSGFVTTGEFDFEDQNFDVYNLCDFKKTQGYWGLNQDDKYYEKYVNKAPHKREHRWPTVEEFWSSMEPAEFKIYATDMADWRKFKLWLKKTCLASADQEPFSERIRRKFEQDVDICTGDYDKVGKVVTEVAVYKWDFTHFMSEEDLKKWKGTKPDPLVKPVGFDLQQAKRVFITKEDLKRRE